MERERERDTYPTASDNKMSRKLFDTKKVELDKHNVNGGESEKERKIILYCHQQSTLNSSHKKERKKLTKQPYIDCRNLPSTS